MRGKKWDGEYPSKLLIEVYKNSYFLLTFANGGIKGLRSVRYMLFQVVGAGSSSCGLTDPRLCRCRTTFPMLKDS